MAVCVILALNALKEGRKAERRRITIQLLETDQSSHGQGTHQGIDSTHLNEHLAHAILSHLHTNGHGTLDNWE